MTKELKVQADLCIGRKVTWQVYGLRFVGTVIRVCKDSDGEESLAVNVETTNGDSPWYPGIPASIFPPGTPNKGNAQWVD